MSIAKNLSRIMDENAVSVASLSSSSGIEACVMRNYLAGKAKPSETVLARLAGSLGCTAYDLTQERITRTGGKLRPEDAANRLGRSAQDIRVGLQLGVLPFGTAYKRPGSTIYTYEINPMALEDYAEAQERTWRSIAAKQGGRNADVH